MGLNDFIVNARIGTFDKLTAKQSMLIGNQAVIANQGTTYYVDSGSGSDSNNGKSWAEALVTLDAAINKCTANQGDTILIAEGHTETYTTTGVKATFDIDGINIIGLGYGSDRPTFSYGHTGTTMTISGDNVTIKNLLFVTAVDQVTTYVTISGDDCTLINCESRDVTDKEVISDFTITGDRFRAFNHFKNGYVDGNANVRVFSMNGVDNALIENCIFMTKVTTAIINFVTNACTNVLIKNCEFYVKDTTNLSKNVIDTIAGSTWEVNNGFDLGAAYKFSGGSGAALASDDVSAVNTAVATLQAELSGADGIAAFPAAAAAANDVSLAEVIRYIQENQLTVPTQDLVTDALTAQVIGKKSDTTAGTSLVSLVKIVDAVVDNIQAELSGADGIAAFPAAAAAANDVSLAEVIRYIQENQLTVPTQDLVTDALTAQVIGKKSDTTAGTSLVSLVKIVDAVVDNIQAELSGADGIAAFPAAAAPANDVSLAEVIRDIWDALRNGTGGTEPATNLSIVDEIRKNAITYNNANYLSVTADLTSATWNTVATHELFTVTGLVRMKVIAEVTTTGDDTSGNTATIQLGVEDSTDDWIAVTEVDDLASGEIWADATPTETNGNYTSLVLDKVVNVKDVGYEIAGEAATDGEIVFHCWWEALNSTGNVVVGDGSAMV